jgi:hypothetical protein
VLGFGVDISVLQPIRVSLYEPHSLIRLSENLFSWFSVLNVLAAKPLNAG